MVKTIKSITDVVQTLLWEELDASLQQLANELDAMQIELAAVTSRIILAEGELATLKNNVKKDSS